MLDILEAGCRPYARTSRENRVWRQTQNHQARKAPRPHRTTAYPTDKSICVVSHLTQYIERTKPIRATHDTKMLISYAKLRKPVSNSTIGKWAKSVLKDSGIDTRTFSGNSARPASTSHDAQSGLALAEILKAGGWTNAQTFAKHYHKPIQGTFGASILSHFQNFSEQEEASLNVKFSAILIAIIALSRNKRLRFFVGISFVCLLRFTYYDIKLPICVGLISLCTV